MSNTIYSIDFGGYKTTISKTDGNRSEIVENAYSEKSTRYFLI